MDGFQVEIQDMNGGSRLPEAEELGMMDIAFCLPLQNFACQEAYSPPVSYTHLTLPTNREV